MIRTIGVGVLLAVTSLAAQPRETATETWTGWFSDKRCAQVVPGEAPAAERNSLRQEVSR